MDVGDSIQAGPKRWKVRLREKGGKEHEMPAHRRLQEALDAYLAAVPFSGDKKHPLFPTALGKGRPLQTAASKGREAYAAVRMSGTRRTRWCGGVPGKRSWRGWRGFRSATTASGARGSRTT